LIRKPFRRPVRMGTACRPPRLTRCNTVWLDTPRARLAYWTQLSGAVTVSGSPSCGWSVFLWLVGGWGCPVVARRLDPTGGV
jgi:hypothetical protein